MSVDEQLISRGSQENKEADNSESDASGSDMDESEDEESGSESEGEGGDGADDDDEDEDDDSGSLREEVQKAKSGEAAESTGDLRTDKLVAAQKQKEAKKDIKEKAAEAALNPAKKALAKVLQSAWKNLIATWGLTLIWIDIHYILGYVFGKNLFCELGEEWFYGQSYIDPGHESKNSAGGSSKKKQEEDPIKQVSAFAGLIEKMGCFCLNLLFLLILLCLLSVISMIVNVIENPMKALEVILGNIWCSIVACKK
ncbi:MAG: hypothetical protein ACOYL8_03090 [Patescibacteria group bacterium]